MSARTPGPWIAVEADEMTPLPAGVVVAVHTASEPWKQEGVICEINGQGDGAYSPETTNANGHLIAASPDLLAVAANHLNNCAACTEESDPRCDICLSALAAIAKAKGRA